MKGKFYAFGAYIYIYKKKKRSALLIQSVNRDNIAMIDAFSRKMPQSGGQKIFTEKERTKKVPLIF